MSAGPAGWSSTGTSTLPSTWHGGVSERKPLSRSEHDRFKWQPDQSSSGLHREALGKSRSSPAQTSTAVEEGTGSEPEEEPHKGRPDGNQAPADTPTRRRQGQGKPVCQTGHTLFPTVHPALQSRFRFGRYGRPRFTQ